MAANGNVLAGKKRRRWAAFRRVTRETDISLALDLDRGPDSVSPAGSSISTGIGFLDHLLTALAYHAGWDLTLVCKGDLVIDDHHSTEDCGIALGEAFSLALAREIGRAHV